MNETIQNEFLKVTIDPLGAQLKSVTDGICEYLWPGDPNLWKGTAPVLFPFIGRLYGKTYRYQGKEYEMPLHGFLSKSVLESEKLAENKIRYRLNANAETKKMYPFDFQAGVEYRLEERKLTVCFFVKNRGKEPMYFVFGGHPGFRLPLEENLSFEDYKLCFEAGNAPQRVLFSSESLTDSVVPYSIENGEIPLRHSLFDDEAIVLKNAGKSVKIISEKGTRGIQVDFPDFPYVGFWHVPKTEAGYVCVEPWTGLPGRQGIVEELETMQDRTVLEPGKEYRNQWAITFFV
ncbi:MAG: aldose 1-epimerase family protein [Eubacteriales bacterium]|nr:aldose 1-epimerase family protein [Eubacteriales bacterium]